MKQSMHHRPPEHVDPSWRIGIVAARFYEEETDALVEGAKKALMDTGIPADNISIHEAPGSFEIPLIGGALAEAKKIDALIGIGIIVEGDTHHARLLADATTQGIMATQLKYGIPFAFEVLYVDSLALAQERTKGEHNKGTEAALAVLHALSTLKNI
jgi:6,7-dimethyl-8-ribityllumazine synthase